MKTEIINDKPHLVFEKGDEKELSQFVGVEDSLWKLPNKEVWIKRIGPLTFKSIVEVESGFMVRAIPQPSIDDLKIGDGCTYWIKNAWSENLHHETMTILETEDQLKDFKDDFKNKEIKKIRLISRVAGVPLRSE